MNLSSYKHIAIICSAPIHDLSLIKEKIATFPFLIAVDGGVNHSHAMRVKPNLILGDLDSANPSYLKEFEDIPTHRYPHDKDKTDLELALELAFHSATEQIVVFGALGGRTDHTLGNLVLLSRYPGKVFFESEAERLFVISAHTEFAAKPSQIISLIPMNGPVLGITTSGLKWGLKDAELDKNFIGISNEAISSKVAISVREGDLLCCVNNLF